MLPNAMDEIPVRSENALMTLPLALVAVLLVLLFVYLHKCKATPKTECPGDAIGSVPVGLTTPPLMTKEEVRKALDANIHTIRSWCSRQDKSGNSFAHIGPALDELWVGYDRLCQPPPDPEADYYVYETLYPLESQFLALAGVVDTTETNPVAREEAKNALWELTMNVRLLGVSLDLE